MKLILKVVKKYDFFVVVGMYWFINKDNKYFLCGFIYKNYIFIFFDMIIFFVYDRIGVGDVYISGILYGELEGFLIEKIVVFVVIVGMFVYIIVGDIFMLF